MIAEDSAAHPQSQAPTPRAAVVERLFREHNEALLRFLALRLGSQQEAKEVAQEAYVKLLSLEADPAASFLRSFLFTIAANMATDRMRARRRHPLSRSLMFEEFDSGLPQPEQQLAGEQELKILERLIAELPAKCRRAFLLHRINGLSTAAIAAQMHLSERMVRHHILRAVAYCRAGLDEAAVLNKGRPYE
jgi:RNA polymerase sigma factor (sigma-70 family)